MPRTKAPKKKAVVTNNNTHARFAAPLLDEIEANRKAIKFAICQEHQAFFGYVRNELNKTKISIPKSLLNKTIGELVDNAPNWTGDTTNSIEPSIVQILDSTSKCNTTKSKRLLRPSSAGDDEGYLTAESTNSTTGAARKSRVQERLQRTKRISRSLSNRSLKPSSVLNKYKTPAGKQPPLTSYGTITPKVAPNVPQVLLRRPKQGEVALSLQGSPLFTGSVTTEDTANVNIPLEDGRVLSIQPKHGLRLSQIPQLDAETKRQLATLRDNLTKVCSVRGKR